LKGCALIKELVLAWPIEAQSSTSSCSNRPATPKLRRPSLSERSRYACDDSRSTRHQLTISISLALIGCHKRSNTVFPAPCSFDGIMRSIKDKFGNKVPAPEINPLNTAC